METPETSKPSEEIDYSFVNLAEGQNEKISKPLPTVEESLVSDEKYKVPESSPKSIDDQNKAKEILENIVKVAPSPETTIESKTIIQEQTPQMTPEKPQDKKLSLGDFMKNYGSGDLKRNIKEGIGGYDTPDGVAQDIYTHRASTVAKVTSVAALAALGIAGPTLSTLVAAGGVASAFGIGLPIAAAGLVGFTGYKMFKSWRAERAFKKNFGKSVNKAVIGRD